MLQELRRADGAGAEHHFAAGAELRAQSCTAAHWLHFHAHRAGQTILTLLEHDALGGGAGPDFQIAAPQCRAQKCLGGVPAHTAALVDLEIAHALVIAAIEVIGGRNAVGLGSAGERVEHVPAQALALDAPFAT